MFSKLCRSSGVFSQFVKLSNQNLSSKRINFSSLPVGVLGAPFSKGQSKYGVDLAPDTLRNYGLVKQLEEMGLNVKDFGNVRFDYVFQTVFGINKKKLNYPLEVGAACHKVSKAVQQVLLERRKCITIGGDHSLGIGTVHGHSLVHDICVLWIDAHADINTPFTSRSGHIHGMSLSFLIRELGKYMNDTTEGFEWLKPCISKSNVAFIGLRDIDPLEKLILNKEGIVHFTMRDIDRYGIFDVTQQALKAINPKGELSLHVSFDIDSIESRITPCTGTPVLGGLTIREALCIAEEVSQLECFRALDIVEVNPALGNKEQIENTLEAATLVTKAFLGWERHGKAPINVLEVPVP